MVLSLYLVSCSKEKSGQNQPETGHVQPSREMKSKPATAWARGEKEEAKALVEELKARAVVEGDDKTAPQSGEINLAIDAKGGVAGTFNLAGIRLSVQGIKLKNLLRLWVYGGQGDTAKVRRGYMIGTHAKDKIEGTFAISGNGGEPVIKGSWRTVNSQLDSSSVHFSP